MAKKTVKEPEAQTMGGSSVKKTKTTKKPVKKAVPKKKGKTKAEILAKPTKVVRKSVVKNEEHSEFEDSADLADDVEREELDADDLVGEEEEEETDDSLEY